MKRRNWWNTATEAQKLEQVLNGHDINLTTNDLAILLGAFPNQIKSFCNKYDLRFGHFHKDLVDKRSEWYREKKVLADRYYRGERTLATAMLNDGLKQLYND